MPVTAKLSKRFYDVLGEDVANELVDWFNAVDLTYRADLRELNELNYARFDAKLEQRVTELRTELRQAIAELRAELREEIAELRTELRQEIATLRGELIGEMAKLRGELIGEMAKLHAAVPTGIAELRLEFRTELQQVRTELLRWMFGFWVTTLLAVAGLLIALRGP